MSDGQAMLEILCVGVRTLARVCVCMCTSVIFLVVDMSLQLGFFLSFVLFISTLLIYQSIVDLSVLKYTALQWHKEITDSQRHIC